MIWAVSSFSEFVMNQTALGILFSEAKRPVKFVYKHNQGVMVIISQGCPKELLDRILNYFQMDI